MERKKISAITTVITIISCKMNLEGHHKCQIKPELIIEVFDRLKIFKDITIEDIQEASKISSLQDSISKNEILNGVRCPSSLIDYVFKSIHIQPLRHLIQE